MRTINNNIQELTYQEVRNDIQSVNPELAAAIDQFDPDDSYKIYRVKYRYGDPILDRTTLNLPDNDGNMLPLKDEKTDKALQENLAYANFMPFTLVLTRSIELYIQLNDYVIPYAVGTKGMIFGLTVILDPKKSPLINGGWKISSGCRSVSLLPKVSEAGKHQHLCKATGISVPPPERHQDQFFVFKAIAQKSNWRSEVLFFSGKWLSRDVKKEWKNLYYYLHQDIWSTLIKNFALDYEHLLLSYLTSQQKPSPNLFRTIVHIIDTAKQMRLGMQFSVDEEKLPLFLIQNAYVEFYNLKEYIPIIVEPAYLKEGESVFYSLRQPLKIDLSFKANIRASMIDDLRKLTYLFNSLKRRVENEKQNFEIGTSLFAEIIKSMQLTYIYKTLNKKDPSICLPNNINNFRLNKIINHYPQSEFPVSAPFFCGCIEIFLKPNKAKKVD